MGFAARRDVELRVVLLAALAALLRRYTREDDIVIATGDRLLWLDAAGDPGFEELVDRVARELAAPTAGHSPGSGAAQVAWAEQLPRSLDACDLALSSGEEGGTIRFECAFDRGVFAGPMVERLLGHLATLLDAAVRDPASGIGALELLTSGRARSSGARMERARSTTIRIVGSTSSSSDRAGLRPEAVAAEFEGVQLSYGELDARANALAHVLQELGVGPGVLAALCVERSLEMLVGVLAIMRAGGAYVPVDPGFPADRKRFMIEDANVGVILTQERLRDQLPEHRGAVICFDRDAECDRRPSNDGPSVNRDGRRPCLRDLHVRLDRHAEGRSDPPSRARQLPGDDERAARA